MPTIPSSQLDVHGVYWNHITWNNIKEIAFTQNEVITILVITFDVIGLDSITIIVLIVPSYHKITFTVSHLLIRSTYSQVIFSVFVNCSTIFSYSFTVWFSFTMEVTCITLSTLFWIRIWRLITLTFISIPSIEGSSPFWILNSISIWVCKNNSNCLTNICII